MVVLRMYLENFNLTLVAVDSNNVPRKVPAFDGFFPLPSKADCIFIRLNGVVIEVVRH